MAQSSNDLVQHVEHHPIRLLSVGMFPDKAPEGYIFREDIKRPVASKSEELKRLLNAKKPRTGKGRNTSEIGEIEQLD